MYLKSPVNELKRVKQPKEENSWLKHIVADMTLQIDAFEHAYEKITTAWRRLSFARAMVEEKHLSIRQACQFVNVPRSDFSYVAGADKYVPVR